MAEDRVFHPLNGMSYAWAGDPHKSVSIKYAAGVEVARNLFTNPSFEDGLTGVSSSGTASTGSVGGTVAVASGRRGMSVEVTDASASGGWVLMEFPIEPSEHARWFGFSTVARNSTGVRALRHYAQLQTAGVTQFSGYFDEFPLSGEALTDSIRQVSATRIPPGIDRVRAWLRPADAITFARYHTDAWVAVVADTEAEAIEHASTYFDGDTPNDPPRSGIAEVGLATTAREGIASEVFARSREKIALELAQPDPGIRGGERVELAAFAASSSEVTWRWRQTTGPEVFLYREGNACHFEAPDVDELTDVRIAVSASSVDGANRSDWHFFDLEVRPSLGRFADEASRTFRPYAPQLVGYNRGKREIWNDVIAPVGMDPEGKKRPKLVDLGIPADDVTFVLDGEEPARASAGAVYVDMETKEVFRNFGGGYNESEDTTGAPRLNAYMVNPATGDVFEWKEGADDDDVR